MTAPPPGSWSRWLVIRGDALTLAVVGVLLGVVLVGLALGGAVPVVVAFPGLALVAGGALAARASRRAWRALLAEVAARFHDHDPGPSPVPWVDDALWRAANRYEPPLDGPLVLLAEVDPTLVVFPKDARGAFVKPHLRLVTAEERDATAPVPDAVRGPAPEPGTVERLQERLAATPGRQLAVEPLWPVCCGRPATLVSVRPHQRPADARWLPAAGGVVEGEDTALRGLHGYRCRACGRAWATDPVW